MVGPSIGPYRILERLGAGGMGEVYLAEDTRLRRQVALKSVSERRLGQPDSRRRLLREARAAATLNHPNIAAIYDIVELDDQAHIVMEYVPGDTLATLLKDGPLPPGRVIEIGVQVAAALEAAHAMGIVHRDLKPSNVMLTKDGTAKILDFGLAKGGLREDDDSTSDSHDITPDGPHVIGTPPYMSPEQLRGQPADARSDVYSFGVLLYELLTGRRPYEGRDPYLLLTAILNEPPPAARAANPSVPVELDAIVARAMSREPGARPVSAAALRADLVRAAGFSGATTRSSWAAPAVRRRRTWPGIAALALLLAAALAWWALPEWWKGGPAPPPAEARRWYEQGTQALREGAYLTASKRLEQAISLHDAYPLAHARLAEARSELDDDSAKDSLLYVQKLVPDLSRLPRVDALYLEGIRAMVSRRFPEAIQAYSALAAVLPRESSVQFDLGRAFEADDEVAKAVSCYERASAMDSQSPAPYLRLGDLEGQQQRVEAALEAFRHAESLYQTASNVEGVAEVAYRRGAMFNKLDRSKEARAELDRALELATQTGNEYQRVRTLLQLSGVAATEGGVEEAERHATEALEQARGMDTLSINGLIDLGNVFFVRGDLETVNRYFQEALAVARQHRARRAEARALLSLGSLRVSQGKPDEARAFLAQALAFYKQGGYPRAESQTHMLMGQASDLRGDFQAAVDSFHEQLRVAEAIGDEGLIAQTDEFLALALMRWERFPEALEQFRNSAAIFRKLGHSDLFHSLVNEAEALIRLGRVAEARGVVADLQREAGRNEALGALRPRIALVGARIAIASGDFDTAASRLSKALRDARDDDAFCAEAGAELALAYARASKPGAEKLAQDALERARRSGDPVQIVNTLLTLGTALIRDGRGRAALAPLAEGLAEAEKRGFQVSSWRASVLASSAASQAGDQAAVRSYARQADERLARLRDEWGEPAVRDLQTHLGLGRAQGTSVLDKASRPSER